MLYMYKLHNLTFNFKIFIRYDSESWMLSVAVTLEASFLPFVFASYLAVATAL